MRPAAPAGLLALAAAFAAVSGPARATIEAPICRYDVILLDAQARSVEVAVDCRRPVRGFRFADDFPADWVISFLDPNGKEMSREGASWRSGAGRIAGARYRIDLDGLAEAASDNSVTRIGRSVMIDLSGVVALPIGERSDAALALSLSAPDGGGIATSLPVEDGSYRIRAGEVDFATSLVLGTFERRPIPVPLPLSLAPGEAAAEAKDLKGEIDLVIMDGSLKASADEIADWVHATALANADLWRGFPVAHSSVVVMPVPGRANVPFGRVISTGGVMVRLMVGAEIEARALYDQWVLVHEFIHLGTPYVRDTGAWLNEGLATYLEPIVRYRAGWRSEESVWDEWTQGMGRGLEPMTGGLSKGDPYWGGALYALMADIELRRLTHGRMGIEDCLGTILTETGDIRVTADTIGTLALGERDSPEPVLTRLAEAHMGGAPLDLFALFDALGVHRDWGKVTFEEDAPLAEVRRWILTGGPDARSQRIPIPAEL